MGKEKKTGPNFYLIDLYQMGFRVGPLFGVNRLVKLAHRKRSGVLYCDNVMYIFEAVTFSEVNTRTVPYRISHSSPNHAGVYSEPRLNAPNEASDAELQRFRDEGTGVLYSFTPKKGTTFSIESAMYKTFDAGHRYVWVSLPEKGKIARWELTLDFSAYLRSGYSDSGEPPRCEFEDNATDHARGRDERPAPRNLVAVPKGNGLWGWHVNDVTGGTIRLAWELRPNGPSPTAKTVDFERLATELSINPRFAKDLHNFVSICHYYVAGFRSLNKIGPEMITGKSVLIRSLNSVEEVIRAELIERTKGKGLIRITPSGEAVLDWWSQFYMRWTPISTNAAETE